MKLTQTNNVGALAFASALSLSLGSAIAGPAEPMEAPLPPPPPPPAEEGGGLFDTVGMTLAAGYDSDYIFRGYNLGHDYVWSQLDLTLPLGDNFELAAGAWYTTPFNDGEYTNELDLYASLAYDFGFMGVAFGYIHYYYPNTPGNFLNGAPYGGEGSNGNETNEIYLSAGTTLGPVDLSLTYYYDLDLEVSYIEGTAASSFPLNEFVSLDPTIGISYIDIDDAPPSVEDSGFNHFFARLDVPIKLTETATLTPYVAATAAMDVADDFDESDYFWGGVSLSVDF